MSAPQSRAASQGDATPRAGRAVAEAWEERERPRYAAPGYMDRAQADPKGCAIDDLVDAVRYLNANHPGVDLSNTPVRRLLEHIDELRAAQATPAEGADIAARIAYAGSDVPDDHQPVPMPPLGKPAGAADRTRDDGDYAEYLLDGLRQRVAALEQECATLREGAARLGRVHSELTRLTTRHAEVRRDLRKARQENAGLRAQNATQSGNIGDLLAFVADRVPGTTWGDFEVWLAARAGGPAGEG
jgi:hypothetical protein